MNTTVHRPAVRSRSSASGRTETEIEVAIRLVTSGAARTVRLSGLPGAARLAAAAAAWARAADVAFHVERAPTGIVLSIGPRTGR